MATAPSIKVDRSIRKSLRLFDADRTDRVIAQQRAKLTRGLLEFDARDLGIDEVGLLGLAVTSDRGGIIAEDRPQCAGGRLAQFVAVADEQSSANLAGSRPSNIPGGSTT